MSVLDIGCGASKRGDVGVDLERTSDVDIVADVHCLPLRNSSFKGCVAYAVLEHVENPFHVIREISRVLMENGWLKIRVPRDSRLRLDPFKFLVTFNLRELKQQYRFLKSGAHKWQLSTRTLKKILERNGFSVSVVTFTSLRRETEDKLPVSVFKYLRNVYIVAQKRF